MKHWTCDLWTVKNPSYHEKVNSEATSLKNKTVANSAKDTMI